jgi:threonine dehydrogenase-like Zn-dependent dehydrogenase
LKNWYYSFDVESQNFVQLELGENVSLGPLNILIKPIISGVCGSDLSKIHHLKEDISVGHEWVGEVMAIGDQVKDIQLGERVTSVANTSCGQCHHCIKNEPQNCKQRQLLGKGENSILSSRIVLEQSDIISLPNDLSLEDLVLLEVAYIGDCAYHAAKRIGLENNDKILIFGAGPIGLFSALSFKLRGYQVEIVEVVKERLNLAKTLGFEAMAFSQVILDDTKLNRYDAVIDCTGDHFGPGALKVVPLFLKEYGKVVIVGKYLREVFKEKLFLGKALSVTWVANHKKADFETSIDFWKDHISKYSSLLSTSFSIHDINKAYELAMERKVGKCILKYL